MCSTTTTSATTTAATTTAAEPDRPVEHMPDSGKAGTSELYQVLMDSLTSHERTAIAAAIQQHDHEVRAADASGVRAVEALP